MDRRGVGRRRRAAAPSRISIRTRATSSRASPAGGARGRAAGDRGCRRGVPRVVAGRPASGSAIFLQAADILERRRDEVVSLLARETGCSFGFGMFQMRLRARPLPPGGGAAYAAARPGAPVRPAGAFAMGVRRPVGVVGAISPWNAALILSARAIASPLVFGNTVVLKPSEESPYVGGLLWGEIFAEAGLPDGVLNIVTHAPGAAGPIGDELVENPRVRRINFTGSTATGRRWPRRPAAT